MQYVNIKELFQLAFEAGEAYADSLEWGTYSDNFPMWYEKNKDQIFATISEVIIIAK